MKQNSCRLILILGLSLIQWARAQDNSISTSPEPYCLGLTYTADVGVAIEPSNDYGCLIFQPNPSWFYFKVSSSGDINLNLYAPSDIDFVLYGPYSNISEMMANAGSLPASQIAGCSYSSSNDEYIDIFNAISDQYYLLLVTNYASVVQQIELSQIAGTGSLDCSIMTQSLYHTFEGLAFLDENNNGTFDGIDSPISGQSVTIDPLGLTMITDTAGHFSHTYLVPDSINYNLNSTIPGWASTTGAPFNFSLYGSLDTSGLLLFGFNPDSLFYNGELDLINEGNNCTNGIDFWITSQNTGSLNQSGVVTVELDTELIFISSSIVPDSINGQVIYFSYSNLTPFDQFPIMIETASTTLIIGDTVQINSSLNILDNLGGSIDTLSETLLVPITCSYDPNNKISLL